MRDVDFWKGCLERDICLKYWTPELLDAAFCSETYRGLGEIGLDLARSMPQPIAQVCGPISSGGLGSVDKNLEVLDKTIVKLMSDGHIIFNQMPFEGPMQDLRRKSTLPPEETNMLLLDSFYLPLFKSGLVKKLHFIHDWQSSFGARWEHKRAEEMAIHIDYLPKDFINKGP